MSSIARWAYTNPVGFWKPNGSDIYGQQSYVLALTTLCAFEDQQVLGSEAAVSSAEGLGRALTIYFEMSPEDMSNGHLPSVGWKAALGSYASGDVPPESVLTVKDLTRYDSGMFGETWPDFKAVAR